MMLSPSESEKLIVYVAADLARKRQARGLKLNVPESVALTRDDVMEEVPELMVMVQVEATFPDGSKQVSVHDPIV